MSTIWDEIDRTIGRPSAAPRRTSVWDDIDRELARDEAADAELAQAGAPRPTLPNGPTLAELVGRRSAPPPPRETWDAPPPQMDLGGIATSAPTTEGARAAREMAAEAFGVANRAVTNVPRAIAAGVPSLNQSFWGGVQALGESTGLEPVADFGRRAGAQAKQLATDIAGPQEGAGWAERAAYGGLQSVVPSVAALAAGAVTGNPAVALGAMGAMTGGTSYAEAREAGVPVPQALVYGASQGAVEAATERLPVGQLLGDLAQRTGLFRTVLHQIATEVPTEQAATVLQDLNEWATLTPERPLGDYLRERPSAAAETLVATIAATALQTGAMHLGARLAERGSGPPPGRPTPQPSVPAGVQAQLQQRDSIAARQAAQDAAERRVREQAAFARYAAADAAAQATPDAPPTAPPVDAAAVQRAVLASQDARRASRFDEFAQADPADTLAPAAAEEAQARVAAIERAQAEAKARQRAARGTRLPGASLAEQLSGLAVPEVRYADDPLTLAEREQVAAVGGDPMLAYGDVAAEMGWPDPVAGRRVEARETPPAAPSLRREPPENVAPVRSEAAEVASDEAVTAAHAESPSPSVSSPSAPMTKADRVAQARARASQPYASAKALLTDYLTDLFGTDFGTADIVAAVMRHKVLRGGKPDLDTRIQRARQWIAFDLDKRTTEGQNVEAFRRRWLAPAAPVADPVPAPVAESAPVLRAEAPARDLAAQPAREARAGETLEPNGVYQMPAADLALDPARFQYKLNTDASGVTNEARITEPWNPQLGGILQVWQDPADRQVYVVNGHHRAERAKRDNATVAVRVIDAPTAEAAKIVGAHTNIAENRGSVIDVATLMRQSGVSAADMRTYGINPRNRLVTGGAALAKLSDPLFYRVATGGLSEDAGIAIGQANLDPEGQGALATLIEREAGKGRTLTPAQITALAQEVAGSQAAPAEGDQADIFGLLGEERGQNLAVEKAVLREWLTTTLAKDKRLFGFVAKGERAKKIAAAGAGAIDTGVARQEAEAASQAHDLVQRLAQFTGPLNTALTDAARRIMGGEKADAVRADLLAAARQAIAAEQQAPAGAGSPPRPATAVSPPDARREGTDRAVGARGAGQRDVAASPRPAVADTPAERPFSEAVLREVFGLTPAQAKHVYTIATGMFTPEELSRIFLIKGGTPSDGALGQAPTWRSVRQQIGGDLNELLTNGPWDLADTDGDDVRVIDLSDSVRGMGKASGVPVHFLATPPAMREQIQAQGLPLYQPAYHGSPHVFDKFSLHAIGTGEGAQAYGWGLYFSSKREVADAYRTNLAAHREPTPMRMARQFLADHKGNEAEAAAEVRGILAAFREAMDLHQQIQPIVDAEPFDRAEYDRLDAARQAALDRAGYTMPFLSGALATDTIQTFESVLANLPAAKIPPGRTYKVEIPEDDDFLDWHKPVAEQSEKVIAAVWGKDTAEKIARYREVTAQLEAIAERPHSWHVAHPEAAKEVDDLRASRRTLSSAITYAPNMPRLKEWFRVTGEDVYREVASTLAKQGSWLPRERLASEFLASDGLAGITYTGDRRITGEGAKNYVVFDDRLVEIVEFDQTGNRAAVEFVGASKALLRALQSPDVSSPLHELLHVAHKWLLNRDVPAELRPGITDQMIDAVEEFLGVTAGTPWSRIPTEAKEKLATAFEKYLAKAKPPSSRLDGAFRAIRKWLAKLWPTVQELDLEIGPQMREVFDLLVTRTERVRDAQPVMTTRPAATTPSAPRAPPPGRPAEADVALPGLASVRGQALGSPGSRLASVDAQAPDDGTFSLSGDTRDPDAPPTRAELEAAGQGTMFERGGGDRERAARETPAEPAHGPVPATPRTTLTTREAFDRWLPDATPPPTPQSEGQTIGLLRTIFGEAIPPSPWDRLRGRASGGVVPIPVGYRRFRERALGLYKRHEHAIRLKSWGDLNTFVHELGHALDTRLLGDGKPESFMNVEILALGRETSDANAEQDVLRAEGVANFYRAYFRDPAWARTLAPTYAAELEAYLATQPVVAQQLEDGVGVVRAYLAQDEATRGAARIDFTGNTQASPRTFWQRTWDAWFDEHTPLKRIEQKLTSDPLNITQSPYWLRRLASGMDAKASAFLEGQVRGVDGRILGPGLKTVLAPIDAKDRQTFSRYLVARHALHHYVQGLRAAGQVDQAIRLEREYGLPSTILPEGYVWKFKDPGLSFKEAAALLKRTRTDTFDEVAEGLAGFRRAVMAYLVERGAVSHATQALLEELYGAYVPLYRVMDRDDDGAGAGGRTEIASLGSPIKTRKGSRRDIIDPLETTIRNTVAMVRMAERNAVWQALVTLAEKTPTGAKILERIPDPVQAQQVNLLALKRSIAQAFGDHFDFDLATETKDLIAQRVEAVKEEFEDDEALRSDEGRKALKAARKDPLDVLALYFAPVPLSARGHDVERVIIDGQPIFHEIHDRELLEYLAGLDAQSASRLVSLADAVLAPFTRIKRAGITLAPDFGARNIARDAVMAFLNSDYGFKPGVDTLRGLRDFVAQGENYWLWRAGGGEMAVFAGQDREEVRQYLREVFDLEHVKTPQQFLAAYARAFKDATTRWEQAKTLGKLADASLLQPLRVLSGAMEAATRLGEFRRALESEGYHDAAVRKTKGISKSEAYARAIRASREVSLDFQSGGSKARQWNRSQAFFNATLLGVRRLGEVGTRHPARSLRRLAVMSVMPAVATVVLRALLDRDDEWEELDPGVRKTYWHIPAPWGWIRYPKAFDVDDLIGSRVEAILHAAIKQDRSVLKDVMPGGLEEALRWMAQRVIPDAILPALEVAANYHFFRDREIVPSWREGLDRELQASRYTSEVAKALGPRLGLAPDEFDHLFYGYTGGLGRHVLSGASTVMAATGATAGPPAPRPARGVNGLPVVGVFVRRGGAGLQAQSIADLFKEADQWTGKTRSRAEYRRAGQAAKVAEVDAWMAEHGGETRRKAVAQAVEALREERTLINAIYRAPGTVLTADEKAVLLDLVEARMGQAARRAMGRTPLKTPPADPAVLALERKVKAWKPETGIPAKPPR